MANSSFSEPNDRLHVFENQISGKADQIVDYGPVISGVGDFRRLTGMDVIINSIRQLFLLPQGYYPFDPEFGSNLYKMIFEMGDEVSIELIRREVEDKIKRYEDRASVKEVRIRLDERNKIVWVEVDMLRGDIPGSISVPISGNDPEFSPFMERE